jgi:hypothetical protein
VIEDTIIILNKLQFWSVNYVKREVNRIAHKLVNKAFSLMDELVYMEEAPQCIVDIVTAERSNLGCPHL